MFFVDKITDKKFCFFVLSHQEAISPHVPICLSNGNLMAVLVVTQLEYIEHVTTYAKFLMLCSVLDFSPQPCKIFVDEGIEARVLFTLTQPGGVELGLDLGLTV